MMARTGGGEKRRSDFHPPKLMLCEKCLMSCQEKHGMKSHIYRRVRECLIFEERKVLISFLDGSRASFE